MLPSFSIKEITLFDDLFPPQTYYYNARTRESSWSKPDGVKIIQQSELNPLLVAGATAAGSGANVGATGPASTNSGNTAASTAVAASPTQAPTSTPTHTLTSSPDPTTTPSSSVTIAGKQMFLGAQRVSKHEAKSLLSFLSFLHHSHCCSRPPPCCHCNFHCCCVAGHRGDRFHGAIPCHGGPDCATAASSLASQCGPAHCSHTCLPTRHGATFPGAFARHAHPSTR